MRDRPIPRIGLKYNLRENLYEIFRSTVSLKNFALIGLPIVRVLYVMKRR